MKDTAQLIDAKTVQKLIAILAFVLPIILVFGEWLIGDQTKFHPTVSQYVHGVVGNFFIGIVCALGILFLSYKGYVQNRGPIPLSDNQLANITGILLIIVATFEALPCNDPAPTKIRIIMSEIHLICAAISFISLGVFSFFYFTQERLHSTSRKTRLRVFIYRICGIVIFAAVITIGILIPFLDECPLQLSSAYLLWLEWIIIWSFALAWCVKGRMILR